MTWRWPWVSRERVREAEDREVRWIARADDAWALLKDERRRYDDLLARYHMLKLQGATTPEPERSLAERYYDPILTAVNNACAGKDPKVRAGMLKQVAIDKAADLSEADIILRIQRGNRPAEEVA